MRKLALLLGALSLVSAVAYGAELKVTNVGQFIEIDNTSGGYNIGEDVHFGNEVGLSYEDWTFDVMARKTWSMDTSKDVEKNDGEGHIKSNGSYRIQLDASRQFGDFGFRARWRQESSKDKFYLKGSYSYDMFSGWADLIYASTNGTSGDSDVWELEMIPVSATFHGVTLAYYVDIEKPINPSNGDKEQEVKQQVRLSAPIYSNDKFALSAEYRYQFDNDKEYKGDEKVGWDENNRHIAILSGNYKVNEALSVFSSYEYDWNKYKAHDKEKAKADDYYGEFVIGWNYSF